MRSAWVLVALSLAATAGWLLMRPAAGSAQPTPLPPDAAQFRISVGLLDREAKQWTGRLSVESGELPDPSQTT